MATQTKIKIYSTSHFKDEEDDWNYFENWVSKLENKNDRKYDRYEIKTSHGKTMVWGMDTM